MIPAEFGPIASHLWQSTLFAGPAALLTLALRRNSARVRYAAWLAASYKFLIPFSWLVSIGHFFEWRSAPPLVPQAIATVTNAVSAPVFLMPSASVGATPQHSSLLPWVIWSVWACGLLVVAAGWAREWWRIRATVKTGTRMDLGLPIPVASVSSQLEPGVFGIFRPVLLLPEGIAERLTPEQLRAVIAHELCHVRRRDNLAAAIHMLIEALFWFHPLVWWLNARIVDERERACDEAVMRMGGEPAAYVETILAVCKSYLEAPACVSGISGSDLKKRVLHIMTQRFGERLSLSKKLALSACAIAGCAAPIFVGAMGLGAQGTAVPASFEVASLKPDPSNLPGRHIHLHSVGQEYIGTGLTAESMIELAYAVDKAQVAGAPSWIDSNKYLLNAKMDDTTFAAFRKLPRDQQRLQEQLLFQSLLADRFHLKVSHVTKTGPVFALVVAKGGPKIAPTKDPSEKSSDSSDGHNGVNVATETNEPISVFTDFLSGEPEFGGRLVQDRTGLKGNYDFTLKWTTQLKADPDATAAPDSAGPSIWTAVQEQLGLRLESTTGPIDTVVIDHIEEPTAN